MPAPPNSSQAVGHADAPQAQTSLSAHDAAAHNVAGNSEEKFRLLVERATEFAMFLIDPDGRIASWNAGARRILGYEAAEVVGQPGALLFTPEDRANGAPERELATAAREGRAADVRWHQRKDGSRFWADGVLERLTDQAGEFKGFAKLLRDATEARQAQQALRASEERLRDAQARLESALLAGEIATWTWDLVNGRIVGDANLARLFSLRPEDAAGGRREAYLRAVHPDDRARMARIAENAAAHQDQYEAEFRVVWPDGSLRWIAARGKIERDGAGRAIFLRGVVVDVSARKAAEAQSRYAARVLDAASDAYVTLDRNFRITYVNAEAARINKKPAEAFLGRLHWDEWPASVGTAFERQFRRAMTERVAVRFLERYYVPGVYDQWIDVEAYPAADEDGGGIHLVYRDVTERIQRERRERFLAELAERARTLTGPDEVIADAVRSVGEFLGLSRCVFADIDLVTDTCSVPVDYCADESVPSIAGVFPFSAFGAFLLAEYQAGRAVVVDDVRADPVRVPGGSVAAYENIGVRAHVSVPVVHSARVVSVIGAHSAVPRHWTPDEVELLQAVAERTWLTVEVARQQRALRESERRERARLADIFEQAPAFMTALRGPQHVFEMANPLYLQLIGRRDVLGKTVAEVLPEIAEQGFIGLLDQVYRTGQAYVGNDTSVVFQADANSRPDERIVNFTFQPLFDEQGAVSGILVHGVDLTERKRLEQERERLLEEQRARAEREALLNRINEAIRATTDAETIQETAAALVGQALGADRCYFSVYDPQRNAVRIARDWHRGDLPSVAGQYLLSEYQDYVDALYASGSGTAVVADAQRPDVPFAIRRVLSGFGIRALLAVPLFDDGKFAAALSASMNGAPRAWTPEEVSLMETVLTQTRTAMEMARVQQRERNIAQQLQTALQPPPPPDLPGLALAGFYRPALEEAGVGGDAYDVFPVEKGCTALAVFDLAGKGLAAASEVATVRNMLRYALYSAGATLAQTLNTLNRVMVEQNLLTGFATLFVGIYDQTERTLTYANCGQEPGLVWRAATGAVEHLLPTGAVLGGFGAGEFTEGVVSLAPGDVIALFTDGLTEVGPTRRELLGVQGVADILRTCCADTGNSNDAGETGPGQTARQVASCLVAGVDAFGRGGVCDDIALLVGVVAGRNGTR